MIENPMKCLLKIKVFNQNKDLKIQSIFCWDEIHLNCCLCWSWIYFFGSFKNNIIHCCFPESWKTLSNFSPALKNHISLFLKYFFNFLLEENKRVSNKWKCFDNMLFNNITAIHFKKRNQTVQNGTRAFKIHKTKVK